MRSLAQQAGARHSQPPTPTDGAEVGDETTVRLISRNCNDVSWNSAGSLSFNLGHGGVRWPNMSERDDYLRRLSEADAHIAEAECAVTEQMAQVEALRLAGRDTAGAERELMAFQETLAVLQDHRASINKAIEQLDGGG
jgi:hypothetical protein